MANDRERAGKTEKSGREKRVKSTRRSRNGSVHSPNTMWTGRENGFSFHFQIFRFASSCCSPPLLSPPYVPVESWSQWPSRPRHFCRRFWEGAARLFLLSCFRIYRKRHLDFSERPCDFVFTSDSDGMKSAAPTTHYSGGPCRRRRQYITPSTTGIPRLHARQAGGHAFYFFFLFENSSFVTSVKKLKFSPERLWTLVRLRRKFALRDLQCCDLQVTEKN